MSISDQEIIRMNNISLSDSGKEEENSTIVDEGLKRSVKRQCSTEEYDRVCKTIVDQISSGDSITEVKLHKEIYDKLKMFSEDDTSVELRFSPSLSPSERKFVHHIADILGLDHASTGKGKQRHICCKKRPITTNKEEKTIHEVFCYKGYVCLTGACVDTSALFIKNKVPEDYITNRIKRDGLGHHITLFF
eukprot:TRINITY_DN5347_c0_g1_i2.p1 TRINITY_DN5347_c0_g1~~TRINITY_DN5347_c0_g1_i2.p1  ORF type:complete len:191 (+),score=29.34 TRINITY_DN5347_c0_g1_i2:60-632(+)